MKERMIDYRVGNPRAPWRVKIPLQGEFLVGSFPTKGEAIEWRDEILRAMARVSGSQKGVPDASA